MAMAKKHPNPAPTPMAMYTQFFSVPFPLLGGSAVLGTMLVHPELVVFGAIVVHPELVVFGAIVVHPELAVFGTTMVCQVGVRYS